jgi:hypothetical protein
MSAEQSSLQLSLCANLRRQGPLSHCLLYAVLPMPKKAGTYLQVCPYLESTLVGT